MKIFNICQSKSGSGFLAPDYFVITESKPAKPTTLSIIILVFLGAFSAQMFAQKKLLTAKVTYIQPYCGGARPTPEMEADAAKTKNYANKTLIAISEKGKVDSIKTDAEGNIKKKMPVGKYKFYESWRYYKLTPVDENILHFNKDCLAKEWDKPFFEIILTKKTLSQIGDSKLYLFCPHSSPCQSETNPIPQRQ